MNINNEYYLYTRIQNRGNFIRIIMMKVFIDTAQGKCIKAVGID